MTTTTPTNLPPVDDRDEDMARSVRRTRLWVAAPFVLVLIVAGVVRVYLTDASHPSQTNDPRAEVLNQRGGVVVVHQSGAAPASVGSASEAVAPWGGTAHTDASSDLMLASAWNPPGHGGSVDSAGIDASVNTPFAGYEPGGYAAFSAPSQSLSIGFVHGGVIASIPVHEGEMVHKGDLLVQLDDEEQQLNVQTQKLAADDTSDIDTARRKHDLAVYDLKNVEDLTKKGSAAPRELETAQAQEALGAIAIRAAQRAHSQAVVAWKREQKRLAEMQIRSPIDGFVSKLEVHAGETLEDLKPAVHVVRVDPLWMDVAIPVQLGLYVRQGSIAVVHWRDIPGASPAEGRVLWISPVADAASNSIIVRLEVDNPDLTPAGLHAFAQFPEANEALLRSLKRTDGSAGRTAPAAAGAMSSAQE